jgi:hypothetical protein
MISIKVKKTGDIIIHNMPSAIGQIIINEFKENFRIPLISWDLEDYQKQWNEGLERIKHEDNSCLVTAYEDEVACGLPFANWWILYKEGSQLCIQNHILSPHIYEERVGRKKITPETCYTYIPPRRTHTEDGTKISEWVVNLEASP